MGIVERVTEKVFAEHDVRADAALCTRFRTPKSGCATCVDACPAGAINISARGPEITAACVDCGVCHSVCPNGVFTMKKENDEELISRMGLVLERCGKAGAGVLRVSCERGDASADIRVPCLGRLTEALLLAPMRLGFSKIKVLRPECGECPNARASAHLDGTISRAHALFEMTGLGRERLVCLNTPLQPQAQRPEAPLSRRELFSAFTTKAAAAVSAALPEGGGSGGAGERTFLEAISAGSGNAKRRLLLSTLASFTPAKEVFRPSDEAGLARIFVSSKCTACGVCARLCPAGALAQKREDKTFILSFRPSLCTNCRVCVETCMPGAVKAGRTARLNDLLDEGEITVFKAGEKTCPICGMDYILPSEGASSGPPEACPLCLDRHRKQTAMLQKSGFMNLGG